MANRYKTQIDKTMKNYIYALLIGLLCTEAKDYTCSPTTDCANLGADQLVPDPIDCQRYYVCVNSPAGPIPSVALSECPNGQYFDVSGSCIAESSTGICESACGRNLCGLTCPTSSNSSITFIPSQDDCSDYNICVGGVDIPNKCPIETPDFNGIECVDDPTQCCSCRPHCRTPGAIIEDPCDCRSYYVCSAVGQPHSVNKGTCTVGYYFDETRASCIAGNCADRCSTCPS